MVEPCGVLLLQTVEQPLPVLRLTVSIIMMGLTSQATYWLG